MAVNGIDSLISLSHSSLLVYRDTTDFCVLILCSATVLNSLVICNCFFFLMTSLIFSMYNIILSANSGGFTSSFRFGFLSSVFLL